MWCGCLYCDGELRQVKTLTEMDLHNEAGGCTLPGACNYNECSTDYLAQCIFPDFGYDCSGNCLDDADGDGVCDVFEGCTNSSACNYDENALDDDGSCQYGACHCLEGTVWSAELGGCIVANPSDSDFDGCVAMTDLLNLLSVFGTCNETPWSCGDPLEYQGYDYETVQIGDQCWFSENLRAENYRNGDAIQLVVDDIDWDNIDGDAVRSSPAPNAHPNAGQLYTFFVVSDGRGVCPNEWHVPSHEEWMVLELDLGLDAIELENWGQSRGDLGLKMKSCSEWNGDCSMQSGFNAVYSSVRPGNGPEDGGYSAEENSAFWSSTPDVGAWYRSLTFNAIGIHAWYDGDGGNAGFSIRCIKDSE